MSELRLRFLNGPRRGQEAAYRGSRVRVGRSRDNDLILPQEDTPLSSGHHAELLVERGGHWWLRDLESKNGTFLNGARVTHAPVRPGDQIGFGGALLGVERRARPRFVAAAITVGGLAAAVIAYVLVGRAPESFAGAAAAVQRSAFLVAIEQDGLRIPLGTAFAVSADGRLATNAHLAAELKRRGAIAGGQGSRAVVISAAGGVTSDVPDVLLVIDAWMHPRWRPGSIRDDVAVLRVESRTPLAPLRLGTEADMARLRAGDILASFGFPAAANDPARPSGRLSADVIAEIRDHRYLQIGLNVAPGMSGSPIFRPDGRVVGIVVGGDFVKTPGATPLPSGSGINWGISVTALNELLEMKH